MNGTFKRELHKSNPYNSAIMTRFYMHGIAPWMDLRGWSNNFPDKSKMADGGHIKFRKNTSISVIQFRTKMHQKITRHTDNNCMQNGFQPVDSVEKEEVHSSGITGSGSACGRSHCKVLTKLKISHWYFDQCLYTSSRLHLLSKTSWASVFLRIFYSHPHRQWYISLIAV